MINRIVETPIGSIEYSSCGEGIPVLFSHGGHSNSRELLAHKGFDLKKYQLITPSRPGYGLTPLMQHTSLKTSAELLVALLDDLDIRKVILIGISAGAPVALELAASFPERVSKLVLVSAVTKRWLCERDPIYIKGKRLFNPSVERYSWILFRVFFAVLPKLMAKSFLRSCLQ